MTYDLTRFDVGAVTRCGEGLRAATASAASMEAAAAAVCRHLFEELAGTDASQAAVMVRCYKTHSFGALPADLQAVARRALGTVSFSPADPQMKCLVLMATTGVEPDWNHRRTSRNHQAIPLPSPHIVERAPMIAQLFEELGFDLAQVVRPPSGAVRESDDRTSGVFHVEEATGSRYIPAQDFVGAYGVKSVLGFGGALPSGDLYASIIFSRVRIPVATADRFRALAVVLRTCFLPHEQQVFEPSTS